MGQWFRKVWRQLFPVTVIHSRTDLIEFNTGKLSDFITGSHEKLYHCRQEEGFKLVIRVLEAMRNLEILKIGTLPEGNSKRLCRHQGAVEAIGSALRFFQDATSAELFRELQKARAEKAEAEAQLKKVKVLQRRSGSEAVM